jgi:DNA polymerase-3 subunit alpha
MNLVDFCEIFNTLNRSAKCGLESKDKYWRERVVVKIVSRKSLGVQPVYDIGLGKVHNFLLENGSIASNCFNKSHSTAYAYVTYQTAFLKANYPAEYMSALLTANSGDQDKVTKYLNNCEQTLEIKVEPPDINRSNLNFKPVIDPENPQRLNILFGMCAIKTVGEGAIQEVLRTRAEGGEFSSLADFCQRVDLQVLKKNAIEALIKCGAFDRLDPNRRQLINDLDLLIHWSQKQAKDKAIGQGNLFDLLGTNKGDEDAFEAAPKSPTVSDFSGQERLQFEQELLGVYVSDHPLKGAEKFAKKKKIEFIRLSEAEKSSRKIVNVVVMLSEIKQVQTKRENKSMAILKLMDITGAKLEAVAFPEAYEKIKNILVVNTPAILSGKISKKKESDEIQLIVDEAIEFDPNASFEEEFSPNEDRYLVLIEMPINIANDDIQLQQLGSMLEEYADKSSASGTPVYAIVRGENNYQLVKFGQQFWVQDQAIVVDRMQSRGFNVCIKELNS